MRISTLAATALTVAGFGMALPAVAAPSHLGPISGTVTIDAKSANAGAGFTWGDGTLTYKGVTHSFSVNGVSIVAIGFSEVMGHGQVYHLKNLADFTGTYAAGTGEATLGHGESGQWLSNEKGVEIHIESVTKGAQLAASAGGIRLELK